VGNVEGNALKSGSGGGGGSVIPGTGEKGCGCEVPGASKVAFTAASASSRDASSLLPLLGPSDGAAVPIKGLTLPLPAIGSLSLFTDVL
jgi:hypothetical protein